MTKAGESIIKGAQEALNVAQQDNNTEWIIIAITQDTELILDASPNIWNNFSDCTYALENGIKIPDEMKKGVYLIYNLTIKEIKTMWTLDSEAGLVTITGDFKLLYDWGIEPGCKK